MGYYSELLDNMIKAGAFDFYRNPEWPDYIKDYFDCAYNAWKMDKETDNELERND